MPTMKQPTFYVNNWRKCYAIPPIPQLDLGILLNLTES